MAWNASTGMWKYGSSRMPSSSLAMLDFPELDVPFRKMIRPPGVSSCARVLRDTRVLRGWWVC
ncbi:hypothetical protein [Streptomyces akebiae]|uniref:hypothetical protein n=1 Tax=Streptomyces akebiae TaxID=2865673 RepID=UPI002175E151|nr:hypothetical protein [Streptomyces akebiae]